MSWCAGKTKQRMVISTAAFMEKSSRGGCLNALAELMNRRCKRTLGPGTSCIPLASLVIVCTFSRFPISLKFPLIRESVVTETHRMKN